MFIVTEYAALSYDSPLILTYEIHCTSKTGEFSFEIFFLKKFLSGIRVECQIVWIQIIPNFF